MTSRASRPEAWFEKADHDLLAIEQLMAASVVLWDIVAFHAQQAAEKYLKGYLVSRGDRPPRIHDLRALLTTCGVHDDTLLTLAPACERLSRVGWISRYPDAPEALNKEHIRAGVENGARDQTGDSRAYRAPWVRRAMSDFEVPEPIICSPFDEAARRK